MKDETTTIKQVHDIVAEFIKERDWEQFHTPKNCAMNVVAEATELMEHFTWVGSQMSCYPESTDRQEIEDEAADVLTALMAFVKVCDIDLAAAFERKMEKNRAKYPIERARGVSTKYTKLQDPE